MIDATRVPSANAHESFIVLDEQVKSKENQF